MFSEVADGGVDATVVTFQARAEPQCDGLPLIGKNRDGGTVRDRPPVWGTMLHADGWTALWRAPRPVLGQIELTGCLVGDISDGPLGRARGRVTRARVVTETAERAGPDPAVWRRIPSEQRLRDVAVAPRWFADGMVKPDDAPATGVFAPVPDSPRVYESGVLVDLDLDDVPPLPLRPSIVPGSLAAHGNDIWAADQHLPLVVRFRARAEITVFTRPGRIGGGYELHADADGCWLNSADGIFRCDHDGTVRAVANECLSHTATAGTTLAGEVIVEPGNPHSPRGLGLIEPSGTVTDIPIEGLSIRSITTKGDGFLLVMNQHDSPGRPADWDGRPWLARLDRSGGLVHGPPLDEHWGSLRIMIGIQPAVVAYGTTLRRVLPDLTLDDESVATPDNVLDGWATNGRLWIATHTSHGTGPYGWQPFAETVVFPEKRQYWALHELERLSR